MNKSNKKPVLIVVIVTIVFIILPIALYVIWRIKSETEYVETKYNLFELNDGVYAIYYTTHSTVPAHNLSLIHI